MAQDNKVSMQIPEEVIKKVKEHGQGMIDALSPYLVGLSVKERQGLLKMGDKTIPFVGKVSDYCELNAEFTPSFLDVEEMNKDLVVVNQLSPILKMVSGLHGNLEDTVMLCGSEAYTASLFYYNSVAYAAKKNNATARPITDDLAERYPGKRRKKGGE